MLSNAKYLCNRRLNGPAGLLAQQAFLSAAERFSSKLKSDDRIKDVLRDATSLGDIKYLLAKSKAKYENEKKFPKARKWLSRAALTIHHYGTVIDVFAQVSPEYVSLVWGSLKLVATVSFNEMLCSQSR